MHATIVSASSIDAGDGELIESHHAIRVRIEDDHVELVFYRPDFAAETETIASDEPAVVEFCRHIIEIKRRLGWSYRTALSVSGLVALLVAMQ